MLVIVLCRVSVSVVKQKLKFFSQNPSKKWRANAPKYVTVLPASESCRSDFGKTLTKVMLQRSRYEIASCFSRAIVVNFCQEIFLAQGNFVTSKTKALRMDCLKVCPLLTTYLVKELLKFTLEQWLASSTVADNFALRAEKSLLPNQSTSFLKIKSRDSASKKQTPPRTHRLLLLIVAGV